MDEDEAGHRRTDLKLWTEEEKRRFDRTLWVLGAVIAVIAVLGGCLAFVCYVMCGRFG
jgi:hypothetical protein